MFHVGQKVVRFGGMPVRDDGVAPPPIGTVCTVANVYFVPFYCESAIELVEYPAPETPEWFAGFAAMYFRPAVEKKTDITVFEDILRRETIDDGPVVAKPRTRKVSAADGPHPTIDDKERVS